MSKHALYLLHALAIWHINHVYAHACFRAGSRLYTTDLPDKLCFLRIVLLFLQPIFHVLVSVLFSTASDIAFLRQPL